MLRGLSAQNRSALLLSSESTVRACGFKLCRAPRSALPKLRAPVRTVCARAVAEQVEDIQTDCDYGLASAQGPRDTMEDEASVVSDCPGGILFAGVFDGHGGDTASQWLNEHLYNFLSPSLSEDKSHEARHADIISSFERADKALLTMLETEVGAKGEPLTGAGSTGTILLVGSEHVSVGNVGDSSAVLSRYGQQVELSTPHRVYGKDEAVAVEIARVEAAGGWVSDCRVCDVLAVSRAFGDWEFKGKGLQTLLTDGVEYEWWSQSFADDAVFTADPVIATPSVRTVELNERDEFIVAATDGLWDFYPQNEVMQYTRTRLLAGDSAQEVADQLVSRTLNRYTSDNVAIVVIKFPWAFKSNPKTTGSGSKQKKKFKFF